MVWRDGFIGMNQEPRALLTCESHTHLLREDTACFKHAAPVHAVHSRALQAVARINASQVVAERSIQRSLTKVP